MAEHWAIVLRKEEKRREAEGSGLLRFNDCLWMIGTNKQLFGISVSNLAAD